MHSDLLYLTLQIRNIRIDANKSKEEFIYTRNNI